jgi:hypothetical protein
VWLPGLGPRDSPSVDFHGRVCYISGVNEALVSPIPLKEGEKMIHRACFASSILMLISSWVFAQGSTTNGAGMNYSPEGIMQGIQQIELQQFMSPGFPDGFIQAPRPAGGYQLDRPLLINSSSSEKQGIQEIEPPHDDDRWLFQSPEYVPTGNGDLIARQERGTGG